MPANMRMIFEMVPRFAQTPGHYVLGYKIRL